MAEVVVVVCSHCGKQLKAPSDRLGRSAKCPQCQQNFILQAVGATPQATPLAATSTSTTSAPASAVAKANPVAPQPEQWTLKIASGEEYGPVSRDELDAWYADGRINCDCQLLLTGSAQWQWASDVYPSLAVTNTPAQATSAVADPFAALGGFGPTAGTPTVNAAASNPYSSPYSSAGGGYGNDAVSSGGLAIGWQSVKSATKVGGLAGYLTAGMVTLLAIILLVISSSGPGKAPVAPRNNTPQEMQRYQRESQAYQRAAMNAGRSAASLVGIMIICVVVSMSSIIAFVTTWAVMLDIPAVSGARGMLVTAFSLFVGGVVVIILGGQTLISGATGGISASDAGALSKVIAIVAPLLMFAGLGTYALAIRQAAQSLGLRNQDPLAWAVVGLVGGCFLLQMLLMFAFGPGEGIQNYITLLAMLLYAGAFAVAATLSMTLRKRIIALQRG